MTAIYQEDDDLDLERELQEIENNQDMMARDMERMATRGRHIRKQLVKRQLDPLVEKALQNAQMLGHALGANEALANKAQNLSKRIAVRDERIASLEEENINDQGWRERALAAEATIERSKKRRSRR